MAVRSEVEGPLMGTLGYIDPEPTLKELETLGMAASFNPGLIAGAGVRASWEFAHAYMEGREAVQEFNARVAGNYRHEMPHMFDIVGFPEVAEWEQQYLPADQLKKYEDSIGGYDPRLSVRK